METSFCELRGKEVINIIDGKRLGRIIDIVFETCCNRILGFVVPSQNKSWNIFKSNEDIFIPCQDICKIGEDVILVRVFLPNVQAKAQKVRAKSWQNSQPTQTNVQTNSSQTATTQSTTAQATQSQDNFQSEQNFLGNFKFDDFDEGKNC